MRISVRFGSQKPRPLPLTYDGSVMFDTPFDILLTCRAPGRGCSHRSLPDIRLDNHRDSLLSLGRD